jgi:hypothetical protein
MTGGATYCGSGTSAFKITAVLPLSQYQRFPAQKQKYLGHGRWLDLCRAGLAFRSKAPIHGKRFHDSMILTSSSGEKRHSNTQIVPIDDPQLAKESGHPKDLCAQKATG